jgi:hypothetical protein
MSTTEIDDNHSPIGDEQQPTETDDNINSTITNDHNNNNNNIDTNNTNPLVPNPDNTFDNTHNQSLEEEDDDPYTDVSSISEEGGTEKLQRNFSNLSGKVLEFCFMSLLYMCILYMYLSLSIYDIWAACYNIMELLCLYYLICT